MVVQSSADLAGLHGDPVDHRLDGRAVASAAVIGAVAVVLAVVVVNMRWRGSDLPAHFFRVGLVESDGFSVWNNHWFGGHHTLGYGVAFPLLGALFGIWTVAVASAGVSALLVDLVIRRGLGRPCLPASLWFAVGTATNVAVGRLPFALGMTVAVGAVLAVQYRRWVLAGVLSLVVATASPVVSVFLVVVYAAWALVSVGAERRRFAVLCVTAIGPVLVIAAMYPQGGMFPFRFGALLWTLGVSTGVLLVVPSRYTLIRTAIGLYMVASTAAFLIPTPLGANISRLGMYAAGPIVLALASRLRVALVVLLPAIWFWQWSPAFDAVLRASDDPSIERADPPTVAALPAFGECGDVASRGGPDRSSLGDRLRGGRLPDRPRLGTAARHQVQPAVLRRRAAPPDSSTNGCCAAVCVTSPSPT